MVSADEIILFVDRLAARFAPQRIMLFGSYACGKPDNDSDVDLLITRAHWSMSPLTAAGRMRVELGVPFPMDLIVRSEGDIEHRAADGDSFATEILRKGITLYAADDARIGSQGRVRLRRRLRSPAFAQEIEMRFRGTWATLAESRTGMAAAGDFAPPPDNLVDYVHERRDSDSQKMGRATATRQSGTCVGAASAI